MKMSFKYVVACVLLVMCLSACSPGSGSTPSTRPTLDFDAAIDCLDLWLNTEVPQSVIDAGLASTDPYGNTVVVPPLVRDADGLYHAQPSSDFFEAWAGNTTPWPQITIAIQYGVGCPYDPVVKAKLDQETQDCLQVWVNTKASQAVIDAGLVTTGPDGVPVSPVLTLGSDGQYRVDILSGNFQAWIADTDDHFVWDNIYDQAIADEGCPYGPSPEQSPAATAS